MTIGEKILMLRQKKKMTQKELGEQLNISDKVISRWETGRSLPDVELMNQIAKVLDVSIAELYDCIDNSPANQEELRDQKIIWKYSRNTIVACMLLLFSCLCLFPARSFLFSSRKEAVYEVLGIIFLFFTIFLFILSIIVAVLEFIYLRQFSRLKYDRSAYKRALKIYSIIFLITLLLTSIADIIILFSE